MKLSFHDSTSRPLWIPRAGVRRPSGLVRMAIAIDGRVVRTIEEKNLFVNAGLPALAALIAGDGSGEFAAAIGVGSGGTAPVVTDGGLTSPAYYKALDGHSEDDVGGVTFNWSLTIADAGAVGITVQELGLFGNRDAIALPGATMPAPLLARKTITPIVFTSGMSLTGSWTLTF